MNKLFIGKSTFYKAAVYNISTKKEYMLWNPIVCLDYNNSSLHDYSSSFLLFFKWCKSFVKIFKCTPSWEFESTIVKLFT